MNKIVTVGSDQYILYKNIGWCKSCETHYECEHKLFIIECYCKGCIVSGGITTAAKVYGASAYNISIWKNMETGELITNSQLLALRNGLNS
jgi:late competence protein required for DNA uptake (superfamily II DNA/RNA helicase)